LGTWKTISKFHHAERDDYTVVTATNTARTEIAIAVVEYGGEFLVGQRSAGVPLAGYWEFPGGKVQAGETPEQAAVRECREESGLEVEILDEYAAVDHDYAHDRVALRFFRCRLLSVAAEPTPPFRWVARRELALLKFPAANENLIGLLLG
jgi:mutator protein MutT